MKKAIRILRAFVISVVVVLLLIRWVGSPIATSIANRKLEGLPQFRGHVKSVQLALWRGSIGFDDLELFDRSRLPDESVLKINHGALSVAWIPLFRGRLGGSGKIVGAEVKMTEPPAAAKPESTKEGPAKEAPANAPRDWQAILQKSFPVEFTRFEIEDSRIDFDGHGARGPAKISVEHFHLLARDLSNRPKAGEDLPAKVDVQALVGGTGKLSVEVRVDPVASQPKFYAKMELNELSLPPIHDFLAEYALIDVRKGTFEVFTEINASGGHYDGYIKPFFKDLEFNAVPDPDKSLAQRAVTKVASAVTNLLKNDENKVATKAPFKGDFAANQVEIWTTIENLLRNAFVQSLKEGLEGRSPSK